MIVLQGPFAQNFELDSSQVGDAAQGVATAAWEKFAVELGIDHAGEIDVGWAIAVDSAV